MPFVTKKSKIPQEMKNENTKITENITQWWMWITRPNILNLKTGKTCTLFVLILGNFFLMRAVGWVVTLRVKYPNAVAGIKDKYSIAVNNHCIKPLF